MLSQGAFNALLKTLEEPPPHVIFILATTEPHKVLPTIISRCQRYDFTRVSQKDIQGRIEEVLNHENIKFDHEATRLISQLSDGGVRDALSILEQVIAYSEDNLTAQHVNDIYGIATTQDKLKLLKAIQRQDVALLMEEIESITQKNIDIRRLTNDLMELLKESVIYAYTKDSKLLIKLTVEEAKSLNEIPSLIALKMIDDLMETAEKYRSASDVLSYFEIAMLKLIGQLNHTAQPAVAQTAQIKTEKTVKAAKAAPEIVIEPMIIEKPAQAIEPKPSETLIIALPIETKTEKTPEIVEQGDAFALNLELPEEKPAKKKLKNEELNDDFILQLMLYGDKKLRLKDTEHWEDIQNLTTDSTYMKAANLVKESTIQASGTQFVLITFTKKMRIHSVNEKEAIEIMANLTEKVLGRPARIYALEVVDYERVRDQFILLLRENKLPAKENIDFFPKTAKNKAKLPESLVNTQELFGENFSAVGGNDD